MVKKVNVAPVNCLYILTTLFIDKPPGGSLPVFSNCPFTDNLLFVNQLKNVLGVNVDLRAYEADNLLAELPRPVVMQCACMQNFTMKLNKVSYFMYSVHT